MEGNVNYIKFHPSVLVIQNVLNLLKTGAC